MIKVGKIVLIAVLLMSMNSCNSNITMPQKGICAHRGANNTHPENTLAAFKEAIRLGAQMIEFDVRSTVDGKLVIIHDKTVDRTTDGEGKVSKFTFDDIRKLDAGSWKDSRFKGEQIPTLSETLDIMPVNIWLNVHIKDKAEIGRSVAELIMEKNRSHQAVIACKGVAAEAARNVDPRIKICNMERGENSEIYVEETIAMKTDFIQLKVRADSLLNGLVKQLDEKGIQVNYFRTNSPEKLETLLSDGVDFVLVDDLNIMMKKAGELGIAPVRPVFRGKK